MSSQGLALVANAMAKSEAAAAYSASDLLWEHLARAALLLPAGRWSPQALALLLNALVSKRSALLSPRPSSHAPAWSGGAPGEGSGGEGAGAAVGAVGERAAQGAGLAGVEGAVEEAMGHVMGLLATPAVGAWKAQEVAMVLNALARGRHPAPPAVLEYLAGAILAQEAGMSALTVASIYNALARLPAVRLALPPHTFLALLAKLRESALAIPASALPAGEGAQSLANIANALVRLKRKDAGLMHHLSTLALHLPPAAFSAQVPPASSWPSRIPARLGAPN